VSAERFGRSATGSGSSTLATWWWRDEDDYHYVVGRLDDMPIVGGENIYPVTVEERLERHEAVSEAVVVPVPTV